MNHEREWNTSVDDSDQLQPIPLPSVVSSDNDQGQESETNPSTPHVSRVQDYALRNALVFADCCVQTGPEAVFDVLARNFDSVGALGWWLHRVGKGELVPRTKGKDLIDALRIVSHTLYRQIRIEIGKPIPRW